MQLPLRERLRSRNTAWGGAPGSGARLKRTGLPQEAAFFAAFDAELARARRGRRPVSVLLMELDAESPRRARRARRPADGDLRLVAEELKRARRAFDTVARLDRGTLALLAPECDENGAYAVAERVHGGLLSHAVGVTVSAGVASSPAQGDSPETLLDAAADALRAARDQGGGRTVISSAEVSHAAGPSGSERGPNVGLAALLGIAEELDIAESGSASHSQRVGRYAELTARELGMTPGSIERVRLAGVLHDIGRIGVPSATTAKPGPLSDADWEVVHSHPEIGARLVATSGYDDIRQWILMHHERPDGRGYPAGLTAAELSLEACILAACDAYEALTGDRPHRPALTPEDAGRELSRGAGAQWDEQVVEALLRVV